MRATLVRTILIVVALNIGQWHRRLNERTSINASKMDTAFTAANNPLPVYRALRDFMP
jgi:hypothetical protein